MPTWSFDEMMVIDTPEKAAALNAAYYAAKKRGPLKLKGRASSPDIVESMNLKDNIAQAYLPGQLARSDDAPPGSGRTMLGAGTEKIRHRQKHVRM